MAETGPPRRPGSGGEVRPQGRAGPARTAVRSRPRSAGRDREPAHPRRRDRRPRERRGPRRRRPQRDPARLARQARHAAQADRRGEGRRRREDRGRAQAAVPRSRRRNDGRAHAGPKKRPADARTAQGTPDPDLHGAGIDWSGRESTQRFFREVYRSRRWRARFGRKVPTVGAPEYKGQPIKVGGGRPDVLVGEARLHWDGKRAYALDLKGERVYIDRLPSESAPNITRKPAGDGGWLVTRRLDDGAKVTVYYNRYGLPEFPARGAFWLPPEVVAKGEKAHRNRVIKQLREMARSNSKELEKMGFTPEQIGKMKHKVELKKLGIRIHHDYRVGRMLIVDERFHGLAHRGGRSLW
ncbi:MAG: hypothetical protein F4114_04850 [Rhodospirillaceae bacterium]|nr:hypothetical protein [Rhodospirillaceae bacterium]MYB13638.1 hypothetical protein [Rhodospirillaceae bacterium]MYI48402.1 hypothetical protein [Rhodospirillaceae bacterium]